MVMRKIYVLIAAAMLIACGCLLASQAEARVCFATDPDCGSGGNFGNMDDLKKYDDTCKINGYDQTTCESGRLKYVCPYKSSWLKCCDPDYNYAACSYPLKIYGECGGKYKCVCDGSKYKYSYDGAGGSSMCVNNSTPGGTSCVHQVANSAKNGLDIQTFYTECKCDRALYPYTPDICDENAEVGDTCIAVDSTGATSRYFSACYCDRKIYQYSAAGCSPYVGDETRGKCSSGGTTYYKTCKSCDGYPAQNLDHVGYNNGTPEPEDYEVCPYRQVGAEYKILACRDPGYRVSKNGDYDVDENGEKIKDKNGNYVRLKAGEKCIPMECEDAVKQFVKVNSSFGLFNGTSLVDENGQKVNRTNAVIAKDMSVGTQFCSGNTMVSRRVCKKFCCKYKYKNVLETGDAEDSENDTDEKGDDSDTESNETNKDGEGNIEDAGDVDYESYEEDPSCVSAGAYDLAGITAPSTCINDAFVCSTITSSYVSMSNDGLKCTKALNYYSGKYLPGYLSTSSDSVKALKVACKKVPTVTYTGSSFPNGSTSSSSRSVAIYGVNFNFSGKTAIKSPSLTMRNSKIKGSTELILDGAVYLYRDRNNPNAENAVVEGNITINSIFKSYGYNYNARKIRINNQNAWTGVMISGNSDSERAEVKADELIVLGIAGFKYVNSDVAKTYVGCTPGGPGYPYSTVTLYNTDWFLYNRNMASRPVYYLYLNSASVFGYGNDGNSNILFATASRARTCVNRTREKHSKNGSHSCNNHVGGPGGNHNFYYINNSGSRGTVNVGNSGSDWCTSGGDYNSPNEWVDWGVWNGDGQWAFLNGGWKAMYPECY